MMRLIVLLLVLVGVSTGATSFLDGNDGVFVRIDEGLINDSTCDYEAVWGVQAFDCVAECMGMLNFTQMIIPSSGGGDGAARLLLDRGDAFVLVMQSLVEEEGSDCECKDELMILMTYAAGTTSEDLFANGTIAYNGTTVVTQGIPVVQNQDGSWGFWTLTNQANCAINLGLIEGKFQHLGDLALFDENSLKKSPATSVVGHPVLTLLVLSSILKFY